MAVRPVGRPYFELDDPRVALEFREMLWNIILDYAGPLLKLATDCTHFLPKTIVLDGRSPIKSISVHNTDRVHTLTDSRPARTALQPTQEEETNEAANDSVEAALDRIGLSLTLSPVEPMVLRNINENTAHYQKRLRRMRFRSKPLWVVASEGSASSSSSSSTTSAAGHTIMVAKILSERRSEVEFSVSRELASVKAERFLGAERRAVLALDVDSESVRQCVVTFPYVETMGWKGLTAEDVLHVCRQLLECLDVLQQQHLLHRDIKPDNILFRPDLSIQMIDFEGAKRVKETGGGVTGFFGTRGFMAPEVEGWEEEEGEPYGFPADIFSAGRTIKMLLKSSVSKKESPLVLRLTELVEVMCKPDPDARVSLAEAMAMLPPAPSSSTPAGGSPSHS